MKLTRTTPAGATGQVGSPIPAEKTSGAKLPSLSPDLKAQAAAAAMLGKDAGAVIETKNANAAAYPHVGFAFSAPNGAAAEEAKRALSFTLLSVTDSAKRAAKRDKTVPPSPQQQLLSLAPNLIATHHAIAEGYDKNLEGKSPAIVAQRQAFSKALLGELAQTLWSTLSIDDAFSLMPRQTAALLVADTPDAANAIEARVKRSLAATKVGEALDFVAAARVHGLQLSSIEGKLLVKADEVRHGDPQAAFTSIQSLLDRSDKVLSKVPEHLRFMSKEDLAQMRKDMKTAATPAPDPKALMAAAKAHLKELEAEIADAPEPTIKERFVGSMIGLAIGDALGGPTEFMDKADIRAQYGLVTDMVGGGWLDLQPGEYTDDTQMAVAMAESIVDKKGFDAGDIADRYVQWLNTDPKDVGNLTRQSLSLRRVGVDAIEAGAIPWKMSGFENAGNGSVMRAAPVCLLTAFGSAAEIEAQAKASSAVSHADDRCTYGTAAMAMAVSMIIKGEDDVLGKVSQWLESRSPILAEAIAAVPDMKLSDVRTSGYVVHTVQAAFWALHHAKSYVDGIVKVSNLGEDTDTAGATAGILLGAKFGVEGIPESWRSQLQNSKKLTTLASKVHDLAHGG